MAAHVKILAVCYFVFGALATLLAFFSSIGMAILASIVGASHDEAAPLGVAVLGLTGIALTIVFLVYAIPSIACGFGLLQQRRWARILGIILAAISLIKFPFGTIFGAYALWVFFQKDTEMLLNR
jgi:hypothetical protein